MGEETLPRIGGAHRQEDAANADADQRADLEELEPEGIDLGLGPLRSSQSQPPQGLDQGVGQSREVEAKLVDLSSKMRTGLWRLLVG